MSTSTSYSSSSTTGCTPFDFGPRHDARRLHVHDRFERAIPLAIQDHGERPPGDRGAGREAEHVALGGLLQHDRREPGPLRKLRHRGEQLGRRLDLGGAQGIERMLGCGCSLGGTGAAAVWAARTGTTTRGEQASRMTAARRKKVMRGLSPNWLSRHSRLPRVSGIAPAFAGSHQPRGASAYARKTAPPAAHDPRVGLGCSRAGEPSACGTGEFRAAVTNQRRRGSGRLRRGFRSDAARWPHRAAGLI